MFDQYSYHLKGVKDFAIEQQLVEQLAVETLSIAIFPWTAWLDVNVH